MGELRPNSVAVVLGTRPEIIKLGHLIRLLGPAARVIHTGQHYDATLTDIFFEAFGIDTTGELVGVGGKARGDQIGLALSSLENAFLDDRPDAVVVQGDTNSTVAAALAANAREIPLIHVEAGLRSFDRRMPEEHNRVITDHLADLCLAPTPTASENLTAEGIPEDRIIVTGNTIVEAVNTLLPSAGDPQRDPQPPTPLVGVLRPIDFPSTRKRGRSDDACQDLRRARSIAPARYCFLSILDRKPN